MSKSRRGKSASANELSRWETELIQAPFSEVRTNQVQQALIWIINNGNLLALAIISVLPYF